MKTLHYLTAAGLLFAGICPRLVGQQFTDVTASVGFVQEKQKSWGNPIWGDINNDGYLDLIIPTHGLSVSGGPFVYLNDGGQFFSDIRSTCGIKHGPAGSRDDGDWHGYAFGDYDQDGNLDLYVAEGAKAKQGGTHKRDNLFRGHGDGTFEYASDVAGLEISTNRGRGAFWVDYDNDGRLDLLVKNYAGLNVLYHNDGNGSLTIVPNAGGLADASLGKGYGSIISFADYDNDGFMDVAITGDGDTEALYRNQGDGTFVDVTAASGITPQPNGKGISWGDYNNDGFLDLFIARGQQGSLVEGASLYRNNGDGTFTDVTTSAGVAILATCWTGVWGDYDNDGRIDLFVTDSGDTGDGQGNANLLYHNNGDGTFTNVANSAGVAMADGVALHKGAAWGDYNNDGFLDLVVKDGVGNESDNGTGAKGLHFLFQNNGNTNHFIKVDLKGVESNLHGIGAAVTVTSTDGVSYRQNDGGGGGENDSQGSEPLHFGLGAATEATIMVSWPSGTVDTLSHVAANSSVQIVEGSAQSCPPLIIEQPRNRHVLVGSRAKFSAEATGDAPLSYQWRKNGDDILGANRSQYSTPPTTLADDGSLFSVVVSNSVGSVTSRNARLTVTSTH
jgi:enediyne biosynthesis protein E4